MEEGGKPWSIGPIGGEKAPRLGESSLSFSITSSCFFRLLRSFALRFWNQILTWIYNGIKSRAKIFLFLFHQYLSFWEADSICKFRFPPDCDVPAVVELFLQFKSLVVGVDNPVLVFCTCASWNHERSFRNKHQMYNFERKFTQFAFARDK